jgi:thiol-disulfide isomerase/thioredoxin
MKKNSLKALFISCSMLLVVSGIYFGGLNFNHNLQNVFAAGKTETGKVIEASRNYLEPGKNKRMMMMDLGSTNCIPCKMMVPVMEELAKKLRGKVDIQFVDVNKRGDLAQEFKIFTIPTQIFFDKNGKMLFRHEGFYPKDEIMAKLKELGMK